MRLGCLLLRLARLRLPFYNDSAAIGRNSRNPAQAQFRITAGVFRKNDLGEDAIVNHTLIWTPQDTSYLVLVAGAVNPLFGRERLLGRFDLYVSGITCQADRPFHRSGFCSREVPELYERDAAAGLLNKR